MNNDKIRLTDLDAIARYMMGDKNDAKRWQNNLRYSLYALNSVNQLPSRSRMKKSFATGEFRDFYKFSDHDLLRLQSYLVHIEKVIPLIQSDETQNKIYCFSASYHNLSSDEDSQCIKAGSASSKFLANRVKGYIFLNKDYIDGGVRGRKEKRVFLHEFCHLLGMGHPHDDGEQDFDNTSLTIMSYNKKAKHNSLQLYDILTLQKYYGCNLETNAGDNEYIFEINDCSLSYQCIWDAGGEDIYNLNDTMRTILDLRQGEESLINGRDSFRIAYGVAAENVKTSRYRSTVFLNSLDNDVLGHPSDTLYLTDTSFVINLFAGEPSKAINCTPIRHGWGIDTYHAKHNKLSKLSRFIFDVEDVKAFNFRIDENNLIITHECEPIRKDMFSHSKEARYSESKLIIKDFASYPEKYLFLIKADSRHEYDAIRETYKSYCDNADRNLSRNYSNKAYRNSFHIDEMSRLYKKIDDYNQRLTSFSRDISHNKNSQFVPLMIGT